MHLHSFAYDFHVRVLSDRLGKLVQRQKTARRTAYGRDPAAALPERRDPVQSNANNPESGGGRKNAVAGFLDDFLKYYTAPPLHAGCLVLAG